MEISRRALGFAGLLAFLGGGKGHAQEGGGPSASTQGAVHDMSAMPASWMGKEQIAFLIYPQFTALDMVGPQYMLANLMGAATYAVARTKDPVQSDTGLVFTPTRSFDDCPLDLDVVCVPGGSSGTLAAMQDDATLRFLKDRGARAKYVTSVCTGSLLLGAAGLLEGYKATSHWAAKPALATFGAIPTDGRVVLDRNRMTGGGVTAGIDFGLTLVSLMRDKTYAQAVQLLSEYAPQPPYDAGTPDRAPEDVRAMIDGMFVDFVKQAETVGGKAFARAKTL
ncbi:DJ-1/PfpI family protein [Methylocella silvestris]|uniref:Thiamine biosynthesis protein ThiJ n=1 Tax=Methylocella silvestris TaxID=199596 RepID=A0A2J7TLC7_METSI|nr:DJ-1/PfpI family protein [Methylocella silvestris]PNG27575.1 thiamine biosynthesis protein ThiJ [Methylocella silvestris]